LQLAGSSPTTVSAPSECGFEDDSADKFAGHLSTPQQQAFAIMTTTMDNHDDPANQQQQPRRRRSSVMSQVSLGLQSSHFMSTLALCSSVFTTFFILMNVFPYSGYMVLFLVPAATKETAGLYAGFLSSAFMVGRACTSLLWGQLADIYGRKFVLVVSLITSAIGSVCFGCSATYTMALAVRFGMGLCNGSMVVARTASSELAKGNKALESKGVGLIMSMVGYGMLLSPAVGGFLSEPMDQHPDNPWFQKHKKILEPYPFILPNLIAAILSSASLFVVILCVEETLPKHARRDWWLAGKDFGMWVYKWCCMSRKERRKHPSVIKPVTSIYVDENQESKHDFENECSQNGFSSEFIDAEEGWENEYQEEWEEVEDILDSMEFVVAATMCASREDRRSFVIALHQDPPLPNLPGNVKFESESSIQENTRDPSDSSLSRVSFSNEKTPLFSNIHKKRSYADVPSDTKGAPPPSVREGRKVKRFASNITDITKTGPTMQEIMSKPSTRAFLISYWLYSFANVAQSEAFPLFAMAHLGQGLGMQESSIGMVGTVSGLIYCIGQYFTFSLMMKHLGLMKSLQYGALFANVPLIFIPCSMYMQRKWFQIGFLSFLQGISMISGSVYLGCNTIGANRTVDSGSRATMNGLSSLGTSMGRGLGPIIAGFLVAVCMSSGIIPGAIAGWVLYVVLLTIGLMAFWSTLSIPAGKADN
jgi:MFS family permease